MSKSDEQFRQANVGAFPGLPDITTKERLNMQTIRGLWAKLLGSRLALCIAFAMLSPMAAFAQITNNPAGDIADAVESGVTIFNSVYAIVIAAVVLGFLLWVLSAARRRR